MILSYRPKEVYGNRKYYPLCDKAKEFQRLMGTTTLTLDQEKIVKFFGAEVQTVPEGQVPCGACGKPRFDSGQFLPHQACPHCGD